MFLLVVDIHIELQMDYVQFRTSDKSIRTKLAVYFSARTPDRSYLIRHLSLTPFRIVNISYSSFLFRVVDTV